MNLRKKMMLLISISILVLLTVQYIFSNFIWLNNINSLEKDSVERNVDRVLNAINQDIEYLNTSVSDWARWNDTYEFVQGNFPDYPSVNLADETFMNFQINAMLFYNTSNQLVYGDFFDLIKGEKIPAPQNLTHNITPGCSLLKHPTTKSIVNGIIIIDNQPMFVSSWPILTNEGKGPIHGSLIMGRYVNEEKIHEIETITNLKISVYCTNDPQLPDEYQKALDSLSAAVPIFIQPVNSTIITGYTLLNDIDGTPSLLVRINVLRDIYEQGLATMNFFSIVLMIVLFIFAGIFFVLLEKIVISKLQKLSTAVKTIGQHKDLTARISESDAQDEVSELTHTINTMLEQLQQNQNDLNKAHFSINESNETLKEKIKELERYKTLTIDRELKMIEMKKQLQNLKRKLEGGGNH